MIYTTVSDATVDKKWSDIVQLVLAFTNVLIYQ